MSDTPQEKLRKEFDLYLIQLISEASNKFEIIETDNSVANLNFLNKFYLFNSQRRPCITNSWIISQHNNSFQIYCVEIESTLKVGRSSSTQTHKFLYGLVNCRKDFGVSLLTKETLIDKVADLFLKIDVDFDNNRSFSSEYRCLSNDSNKFTNAMSDRLMDYLTTVNHVELEFKNSTCLFRTKKSIIDQKHNFELFSIGIELSKILT